jgi:hypothetical protein
VLDQTRLYIRRTLRLGWGNVAHLLVSPGHQFYNAQVHNLIREETGLQNLSGVTYNDLMAAFEPAEGRNRTKYDPPQVATRSNQSLHDRKVLVTATSSLRKKLAAAYEREMDRAGFEREAPGTNELPDGKAQMIAIVRRMGNESDGEVDIEELPALSRKYGDDPDLPEDVRVVLRDIVAPQRAPKKLPDVAHVLKSDHTIRKTLRPTTNFEDLVELDRRLYQRDKKHAESRGMRIKKRKRQDLEELEGLTGERRSKMMKQIGLELLARKQEDGHTRFYSPPLGEDTDDHQMREIYLHGRHRGGEGELRLVDDWLYEPSNPAHKRPAEIYTTRDHESIRLLLSLKMSSQDPRGAEKQQLLDIQSSINATAVSDTEDEDFDIPVADVTDDAGSDAIIPGRGRNSGGEKPSEDGSSDGCDNIRKDSNGVDPESSRNDALSTMDAPTTNSGMPVPAICIGTVCETQDATQEQATPQPRECIPSHPIEVTNERTYARDQRLDLNQLLSPAENAQILNSTHQGQEEIAVEQANQSLHIPNEQVITFSAEQPLVEEVPFHTEEAEPLPIAESAEIAESSTLAPNMQPPESVAPIIEPAEIAESVRDAVEPYTEPAPLPTIHEVASTDETSQTIQPGKLRERYPSFSALTLTFIRTWRRCFVPSIYQSHAVAGRGPCNDRCSGAAPCAVGDRARFGGDI